MTHSSEPPPSRSRWNSVAGVIAAAAALVALILGVITIVEDLMPSRASSSAGQVTARAWVLNRTEQSEVSGEGLAQTLASTPTVEAILENGTRRTIRILAEDVTIEAYASLGPCYFEGAGPIPVAGHTNLMLPELPLPSERQLRAHLHGEIAPGGATRLQMTFSGPKWEYGLYRLRIKLETQDPHQAIDLGRFVLSEPAALPRFGLYLPESQSVLNQIAREPNGNPTSSRQARHLAGWCFRRNLAALRDVLPGPGERSEEVATLSNPVLVPRWESAATPGPARAAAIQAVAGDPVTAIYAASEAGDRRFEQHVRGMVAAREMGVLRKETGSTSDYQEHTARLAVTALPAPAEERALAETVRRLAQQPGA